MASLPERLRTAMNEARKRRDQARTLLLSTILSDIQNREIELKHPATDDDAADVLRRGVKRRKESVEAYEKGQREDLAARERAELPCLLAPRDAAVLAGLAAASKSAPAQPGFCVPSVCGGGNAVFRKNDSRILLSSIFPGGGLSITIEPDR